MIEEVVERLVTQYEDKRSLFTTESEKVKEIDGKVDSLMKDLEKSLCSGSMAEDHIMTDNAIMSDEDIAAMTEEDNEAITEKYAPVDSCCPVPCTVPRDCRAHMCEAVASHNLRM